MSCLKKVIDTVETECGKSFTDVVLWSDGMDTQFRSRFICQLLTGTMFLNLLVLTLPKNAFLHFWCYNYWTDPWGLFNVLSIREAWDTASVFYQIYGIFKIVVEWYFCFFESFIPRAVNKTRGFSNHVIYVVNVLLRRFKYFA